MKRKTILKVLSCSICIAIALLAIVLSYNHNRVRVYKISGDYVLTDDDIIAIRTEDSSNPGTYVTTTMYKDINTNNYYFDASRSYCLYGGKVEFDDSNYQILAYAKNTDVCYVYFSLLTNAPLGVKAVLDNGGRSAIEAKGDPDFSQTSPAGGGTYIDTIASSGNTVTLSGNSKIVFYSTTAPTINSDGTYTFNSCSTLNYQEFKYDKDGAHADGTLYLTQLATYAQGTTPICSNLSYAYAITNVDGNTFTYNTHQAVSQGGGVDETGMYAAKDNDGMSYYYRGAVTNNYVSFSGKTWRIIRVNGDGSVRMIYAGTMGSAAHDNPYNNWNDGRIAEKVGYVYTVNQAHGNGSSSYAKSYLETVWYTSNLTATARTKIADSGFCAERTTPRYEPIGDGAIWFNAYYRFIWYGPTFYCPSEDRLFTTNGLTYPVGLITADEMMYAGLAALGSPITFNTSATSTNYLTMSTPYWSMTPYRLEGCNPNSTSTDCREMVVSNGRAMVTDEGTYDIRPVINLKADVVPASGNGTSANPYVIS